MVVFYKTLTKRINACMTSKYYNGESLTKLQEWAKNDPRTALEIDKERGIQIIL